MSSTNTTSGSAIKLPPSINSFLTANQGRCAIVYRGEDEDTDDEASFGEVNQTSGGGLSSRPSLDEATQGILKSVIFFPESEGSKKKKSRKVKKRNSSAAKTVFDEGVWRERMAAFDPKVVTEYIDSHLKDVRAIQDAVGSEIEQSDKDNAAYRTKLGTLIKDALPDLHQAGKLLSAPSLEALQAFESTEMSKHYQELLTAAETSGLSAGRLWTRGKRIRDEKLDQLQSHLSGGNEKWPKLAYQYHAFLGAMSRLGNEETDFHPIWPNHDYLPVTDPNYQSYMSTLSGILQEEIDTRRSTNEQRAAKALRGEEESYVDKQEDRARKNAFQSLCGPIQTTYFSSSRLPEDQESMAYLTQLQKLAKKEASKKRR